ncbi:MAG TPA: FliG C-terminal domain-containing protein [Rectinemataceae bacterium]|nr:FliG C-terminal domain-containing protein [Rectinemataceae bacterium]
MRDFGSFIRDSGFPDYVIQMALRDFDSEPLALALADQEEDVRQIIFGNMSLRAVAFLKEEIKEPDLLAPEDIRAAQEHFVRLLEKHNASWEKEGKMPEIPKAPELDLSSREAIVASFSRLAQFARRQGLLPLDDLRAGTSNPMMRQGLMMLVEGWDPLLLRSILERYKESWLRAQEIEYDLIIEGIDSLASRDHSLVTEQKLRSIVAGL